MILSMTGFVAQSSSISDYTVEVTVRSLNSKSLDINVKIPKRFFLCEENVRTLAKQLLRRGKVDINITVESSGDVTYVPINEGVVKYYWNQLQELSKILYGAKPPTLRDVLSIPYIYASSSPFNDLAILNEEKNETVCSLIMETCEDALHKLTEMKGREGSALADVCESHINTISSILAKIEEKKKDINLSMKDRIRERLQKILDENGMEVDEHLVLQEAAILLDRTDITEEIERLRAHINHFSSLAFSKETYANGRQLDFIVQEMHREANTIGAKVSDLTISENVILLKTEIAKLKEQVQNIE